MLCKSTLPGPNMALETSTWETFPVSPSLPGWIQPASPSIPALFHVGLLLEEGSGDWGECKWKIWEIRIPESCLKWVFHFYKRSHSLSNQIPTYIFIFLGSKAESHFSPRGLSSVVVSFRTRGQRAAGSTRSNSVSLSLLPSYQPRSSAALLQTIKCQESSWVPMFLKSFLICTHSSWPGSPIGIFDEEKTLSMCYEWGNR